MSVPNIALLLGAPVGTVASRLRRGRELFQTAATRFRARQAFPGGAT
jgi:RNA polymerase sigma-70 factor, ECF subfamily